MTKLDLTLDINSDIEVCNFNKEELSFLVSKVFEEYIEELQDRELSRKIKIYVYI